MDRVSSITPRKRVLTGSQLRRLFWSCSGRESKCVIVRTLGCWTYLRRAQPDGHAAVPSSSPSKPIRPLWTAAGSAGVAHGATRVFKSEKVSPRRPLRNVTTPERRRKSAKRRQRGDIRAGGRHPRRRPTPAHATAAPSPRRFSGRRANRHSPAKPDLETTIRGVAASHFSGRCPKPSIWFAIHDSRQSPRGACPGPHRRRARRPCREPPTSSPRTPGGSRQPQRV